MRRMSAVLVAAASVVCGCGDGGEEPAGRSDVGADPSHTPGSDGTSSDGAAVAGLDPDFDVTTLPEDFPAELVPPVWVTGEYTIVLGVPAVSFESSMSFDDLVTYYDSVHSAQVVVEVDAGERHARWTQSPPWIVSVVDSDPALVGISHAPDG